MSKLAQRILILLSNVSRQSWAVVIEGCTGEKFFSDCHKPSRFDMQNDFLTTGLVLVSRQFQTQNHKFQNLIANETLKDRVTARASTKCCKFFFTAEICCSKTYFVWSNLLCLRCYPSFAEYFQ